MDGCSYCSDTETCDRCNDDRFHKWDSTECTDVMCYIDYCDNCDRENTCTECSGNHYVDEDFMCSECLEGCDNCSTGEVCERCSEDLYMHWDMTMCSEV